VNWIPVQIQIPEGHLASKGKEKNPCFEERVIFLFMEIYKRKKLHVLSTKM